ncbi:MAG: indolepyruvate ferredoxin oxidoreductase family protein, partial [Gammaproteobacteria bacterium]|nr:indolepyruvate ferredoxin oxidoreductase family protein [Gammaproteobacteria bacterium]
WGRRTANDRSAVEKLVQRNGSKAQPRATEFDEIVSRRVQFLADYQDSAYAERYHRLVKHVADIESHSAKGMKGFAEAVARYYFKLLAYKDEYEVARLYTHPRFTTQLNAQFEGNFKLQFHLAPPLVATRETDTGYPKKRAYGPWMLKMFSLLAKLKRLRGTRFDIFGYSSERKMERQLIDEYETTIEELLRGLNHDNHALAVEIASVPEQIRGYGHIKQASVREARATQAELLDAYSNPTSRSTAA